MPTERDQGTSSVEVDASDAKEQPIMVTLEVRVLGPKGRRLGVASASYQTCTFPPPPNKALQLTAR